jgi:hypothetical protein
MVLCNPTDVRGKAGTGSVLSLDAVGRQEAFLNGTDSYFDYKSKKHSNFTLYQSSIRIRKPVTVDSTTGSTKSQINWPFGQTIVIDNLINPQSMGDLLRNIFLKCQMPVLKDAEQLGTKYCDQIGRAILKSVSFTVDGYEIEKIYGDWNVIHDQLYLNDDEKIGLQSLVNGGQPEGTLPTSSIKAGPIDIFAPLNFFFSNNDSTYFPICAVYNQKIKIVIEFNSVSFFSDTHTPELYSDVTDDCSLDYFDLVFDQIVVTPEERLYMQTINYTLPIEIVRLQPTLDIPPGISNIKNYLVPNINVETFHWFFRKTFFENVITTNQPVIFNRYNFSNTDSADLNEQALYPIMSDAMWFLNGQSQLGFLQDSAQNRPETSYYYKYTESLTSNLSSPTRNVYTFSFALDPMLEPFSGAMDFSQMVGDKTFIDVSLLASAQENYTMHMFYMGNTSLTFSGGFMQKPL